MSNICAGIGRGQMLVLEDRIKQRRANFEFYKKAFAEFPGIACIDEPAENYYSNHWLSVIKISTPQITREELRLALVKENIDSRPPWKPMHLQPVFSQSPYYGSGISEMLFDNGICLPSGSNLSAEDLKRVVSTICDVISKKSNTERSKELV
jgi:dTDP-4-amino-4,6-dideoxygalactose transaminase